jgi:hypothetical protein
MAGRPPAIGFGPVTGFGGYRVEESADQISAEWRVPSVVDTSPVGYSATWIGLQSGMPGGPFIQLGTYSVQSPGSTTSSSGSGSSPSYGVFWSDTALKYEAMTPVRLSRPGDLIAFDMTRGARGWKLNVHDVTVGWSRSIEVDYGGSDRFSQAEWVQEDPASGEATTTDVPYPLTSTVAFEDLEVDHRPPHLSYSRALVLSTTSHVFLVPSRPHDDGFALVPATGAAVQLLTDVESFESAVARVNLAHEEDLEDPTLAPLPTAREITQPMSGLAHLLAGQDWPGPLRSDVHAYVLDLSRTVRSVDGWGVSSDRSWATLATILDSQLYLRDQNRLRASVGLPPNDHL